ncbi:flavodoxin domain-containing protein [Clostridium oryzae]|uniref:Protoporphyrinogen oxidase n=1 Tax=Clostridium oryzae TaxID=1450648 RepID=A0A1V4IEX0_9CLOT|nr:flavodoxin domain-containing protein [Clostridium oryzae]OPJ58503.1 protoporphyrinogen oxidase [Clostridium oryzae]
MKTAILYITKHNFTEKCVERLSQKLEGTIEKYNLKERRLPDINQYDSLIIGGPVYMGQVMPEVKQFVSNNLNVLETKKLGLFLCGLSDKEKVLSEYSQFYPESLINSATAKAFFGGAITIKDMNFFEKLIIRIVTKSSKDILNLLDTEIDEFAAAMNNEK